MGWVFEDVPYGLRCLARSPGFSGIAILTLAVSIAANTSIFSVIEAVRLLLFGTEIPAASCCWQIPRTGKTAVCCTGILKFENQAFEDVAAYYRDSGFSRVTLTGAGEPQSVQGAFVTANLFPMMGIPPILGRFFTPEEEMRKDHVILLSHGLWVRRFGASPDLIGKALEIDGVSFQVIGVMPAEFQFPARGPAVLGTNDHQSQLGRCGSGKIDPYHGPGFYQRWQAIGRLKPGVKLQQTQIGIDTIFARIRQVDKSPGRGMGILLHPLGVNLSSNLAFTVLFCAVLFVLLIACTRGSAREREIAIRVALGANRGRLVRQLFTESVLLCSALRLSRS